VCFCDDEMMSKSHKREKKKGKQKKEKTLARQPQEESAEAERRAVFREVTFCFFSCSALNVVGEKHVSHQRALLAGNSYVLRVCTHNNTHVLYTRWRPTKTRRTRTETLTKMIVKNTLEKKRESIHHHQHNNNNNNNNNNRIRIRRERLRTCST